MSRPLMAGGDGARPSIVHVCTRYRKGGSEQRVRDLVAAVDADHLVLVGGDSDLDRASSDLAPARVEQLMSLRRSPVPSADATAMAAIAQHLTAARADLLITHQSKAGLLGRTAARWSRTPVLHSLSMASTGPGYGRIAGRVFETAERVAADWGAGYMVVGDDLRQRAVANGVRPDRCHIVRSAAPLPTPGVDRSVRRASLPQLSDIADHPWIVSVGALEARKRTDQFPPVLAIIRRLIAEGSDPRLIIAGEGPERSGLMERIDNLGLQQSVRMVGHIGWAPELIAASDVLLMASRAEGLPQVLVQAAAADTPFVAFRVDGPAELLSMGARGTVVAAGDRVAMARAAVDWLGQRSESTRPRIDLSSWQPATIAERYRQVVAEVLSLGLQPEAA